MSSFLTATMLHNDNKMKTSDSPQKETPEFHDTKTNLDASPVEKNKK